LTTSGRGRDDAVVCASEEGRAAIEWPDGKRFALTIVDDTEGSTLENVPPVYDLLRSLGLVTTKTVWPLGFRRTPRFGGGTLGDEAYRDWVLELAQSGFEVALHGGTDHSSTREETIAAIDRFREVIGADPRVHVNHFGQREGMYWGDARLDGLPAAAYRAATRLLRSDDRYYGHVEGSEYFWGDVCRERIEYVRNFTTPGVNTLRFDPLMPYHDPRRPYVRFWFSSSEAPDRDGFCRLLSDRNQDRLVAEGGLCIVYTHFAFGFSDGGRVDPRFRRTIERLADLPGWFAPVSTILDHIRTRPGWRPEPPVHDIRRIQRRWLRGRLRHGRR